LGGTIGGNQKQEKWQRRSTSLGGTLSLALGETRTSPARKKWEKVKANCSSVIKDRWSEVAGPRSEGVEGEIKRIGKRNKSWPLGG